MSSNSIKFTKFDPKPTGKAYWKLRLSYLFKTMRTRAIPIMIIGTTGYLIAFNLGMRWWKGPDHPVNRLQWQMMKAQGRLPPDLIEKEEIITKYYKSRLYIDTFGKIF